MAESPTSSKVGLDGIDSGKIGRSEAVEEKVKNFTFHLNSTRIEIVEIMINTFWYRITGHLFSFDLMTGMNIFQITIFMP